MFIRNTRRQKKAHVVPNHYHVVPSHYHVVPNHYHVVSSHYHADDVSVLACAVVMWIEFIKLGTGYYLRVYVSSLCFSPLRTSYDGETHKRRRESLC